MTEQNKIPTQLQIGGQIINIKIDDSISYENELANTNNALNEIILATKCKKDAIPFDTIEQSLWHEIVHQILNKMNEFDLSGNETFVQTFSLLLHQAIKTLK